MNIQWYPGHMTKTRRMIAEQIKNVDAVCEILDARIPVSSRNPDVDELTAGKPRMVVLNRVDQADPEGTKRWADYFRGKGYAVLESDAKNGVGTAKFAGAVRELLADKLRAYAEKGMTGRVVRVMILGIPNVGKSTFINTFAGRACAKTGNKPGVTKGKQWIRLNKNVELLDTPGILWPKFEDEAVGMRLAYIGSIKDDILNMEELSLTLIDFLREKYSGVLEKRYQIQEEGTAVQILEAIARSRGCLKKGEELDYAKASLILFDDFRSGKIGKITLEWVPEEGK